MEFSDIFSLSDELIALIVGDSSSILPASLEVSLLGNQPGQNDWYLEQYRNVEVKVPSAWFPLVIDPQVWNKGNNKRDCEIPEHHYVQSAEPKVVPVKK